MILKKEKSKIFLKISYSITLPWIINLGSGYTDEAGKGVMGEVEEGGESKSHTFSSYKAGISCFIFDIDDKNNAGSSELFFFFFF